HAGANLPIPAPRLKEKYEKTVRPKLMQQFGFTNPHQVPTLEKIAINVGVGEAIKQPKMLDAVIDELAIITGQAPVRKKAKKSIANYGLRQGQEIDQIHGMDITFVTSVEKDDQAHALLKELGMPFRTDEKASKKAS